MAFQNPRALKAGARNSLAIFPGNAKKIILIHTGVSVSVTLLSAFFTFILEQQIANTGGLSGMGTRSMLSTVQSFLQLVVALGLFFWEAGYLYATISMSRRERTETISLLEGFRRFGPLLRCMLLNGLINFGVGIVCFFIGSQIFLLTPFAQPLIELTSSLSMDPAMMEAPLVLDKATQLAIMDAYTPMLLFCAALFLIGLVFVSYFFRMANFLIMDGQHTRATYALRASVMQMRGKKLRLFKLDMSFWWFYGLQALVSVLAYGDSLLPIFGVSLPFSADAAYFIFLTLSLAVQTGLYILFRNRVDVTYAHFYNATLPRSPKANG